jgi:serine/threonine protein kinase
LLEALVHIHEQSTKIFLYNKEIIHRDIKPENILFKSKEDPLQVAIIDFGLAAIMRFNRIAYPKCGSPGYTAPEVLTYIEGKKMYSGKCDVYSLGIVFFNL